MTWQCLGAIDPKALWDSRLQLHWAAQAAAGVGRTLLPKQVDFSQESLEWSPAHGAFLQDVVDAPTPFCGGVRLRDMTLLLLDSQGSVIDEMPMNGRTLTEGYEFFASRTGSLLGREVMIARPPDGMPPHAVAEGATFNADPRYLEELERHFSDAYQILCAAREHERVLSAVRCWPHHFDIALLITLSGSGEEARTVGVGMAPGDVAIREPYYYITPWPHPKELSLPALPYGRWNRDGWFGALLLATEIATIPCERQPEAVTRFVDEATQHCRQLASE